MRQCSKVSSRPAEHCRRSLHRMSERGFTRGTESTEKKSSQKQKRLECCHSSLRHFGNRALGGLFLDDFDDAALGSAFALGFVEDFLAEAQVFRSGFDVLVGADVLEGALEGELEWWLELDAFAVTLGTHVGEALLAAWIHGDVVFTSIFTDNHA